MNENSLVKSLGNVPANKQDVGLLGKLIAIFYVIKFAFWILRKLFDFFLSERKALNDYARKKEFLEYKNDLKQKRQRQMIDVEPIEVSVQNVGEPRRVNDMLDKSSAELEYIFGKFFEKGEINILAGRTSVGKTYALYHILYCIADGTPSGMLGKDMDNHPFCSNLVIAYLGESSVSDVKSRFADHPKLLIFTKEDCSLLNKNLDYLLLNIRNQIAKLHDNTSCTIGLDNLSKLCDESSDWTRVGRFYSGLESIIAEAKKRNVIVSVILVCHTSKDSKYPSLGNFQGLQNKVNLCKNIVEIFPCGLGKEYKMLVPLKCKYDNTLEDKAFIIKQYKSEYEPQKLFEFCQMMDLNEALSLTKNMPEKSTPSSPVVEDVANSDIISVEKKGKGRPQTVSDDVILDISIDIKNGMTQSEACNNHAVSRSTYTSRAKALGLI